MAFLGASQASASLSSLLCKVHTEPCPAGSIPSSVHFASSNVVLKTNLGTVLCLSGLLAATTLGLGTAPSPQVLHVTSLVFSSCGTNIAHDNCTLTTIAPGLIDILRLVLNLGDIEFLNLQVAVTCTVFDCIFGGPLVSGDTFVGALHTAKAGHGLLSSSEVSLPKVSGFLCPAMNFYTADFEALEHLFLVG